MNTIFAQVNAPRFSSHKSEKGQIKTGKIFSSKAGILYIILSYCWRYSFTEEDLEAWVSAVCTLLIPSLSLPLGVRW